MFSFQCVKTNANRALDIPHTRDGQMLKILLGHILYIERVKVCIN